VGGPAPWGAHDVGFALQLAAVRWPGMFLAIRWRCRGRDLGPRPPARGYRPVWLGSGAGRWLPMSLSPPSDGTQRSGPAAVSGAAPLVSRTHSHMDTCSWWAIVTARITGRPAYRSRLPADSVLEICQEQPSCTAPISAIPGRRLIPGLGRAGNGELASGYGFTGGRRMR
jgi:hypothetical protein